MITLFMVNGPDKDRVLKLEDDTIYVGRSDENQVQIKDTSVSRRHLQITKKGDAYVIEDLGSMNGTFINDKPVSLGKTYTVKEGVPIGVGKIFFSLGRKCSGDILTVKDFIDLSGDLGNTGLFNRPGTTPKNLEFIYKVTNALMESFKINEILERVLDYIFDLFKRIDRGAIILLDTETGEISEIISRSTKKNEKSTKTFSRTIVERVIKERKAITMTDTLDEERADLSKSMEIMKIRSVMCVPLISRSQVRGVVYVDSVGKPYGFRNEDLSLLTALSSPAAIAIENALLYSSLEKIVEERTGDLKATETKLLESEARFKAMFDNMSSGVVVYGARDEGRDFKILDANRANQRIEKVKKEDLKGKRISETLPDFMGNGLVDVLRRVWRTGSPESCSITLFREDGAPGWREYYVYRLPTGEIVAIFDDITAKKRAEEEQRALQQQLLVSQKMESIGAFAGGTAHNFRNILQAISGNIEYIEVLHGDNPEVKELAKDIYDSVEKGVDLINNLLHFSRRGGGYQVADMDLADVIKKTSDIIDRVFNKNIKITVDLQAGLFMVGNQSLLSQVFMNLFSNARDAMPDGGRLGIEAKRRKDKIVVTVSDTGYGMDEETLEKIFDPFFTLKDVGKGTGLGLSTTHGIVEEHKGSISVSSKPGVGTTFKIVLPWSEPETLEKSEPQKQIVFGKGQKILIVDDERPTLEALTHLANSLGYIAVAFDNPREALNKYKKLAPDLVLMDRSMPEMDGTACINEIMKIDRNARIIIVSGYEESGPDGIDDEIKTQIKGYLTKPCGLEEISLTISQALET